MEAKNTYFNREIQNLIESDVQILDCVTRTLQEYFTKETGYELAIKASIYQLIVLLLSHKLVHLYLYSIMVRRGKWFI